MKDTKSTNQIKDINELLFLDGTGNYFDFGCKLKFLSIEISVILILF
jgi:hypothetical protein